jgi:competence protein ComEC
VTAPGFWLSFGAVAAIMLAMAGRGVLRRRGWPTRFREAARVQVAVTLALVPLTVALFQNIAVLSIVANAVAIPLVSLLVTPLALVAGLLVLLPEPMPSLAVPCLAFAHAALGALHAFLVAVGSPGWASVALPAPPWWTVPLAVLGVAWMLSPPGWPLRWAGSAWLLPMLLWPAQRPAPGQLWMRRVQAGYRNRFGHPDAEVVAR